MQYTDAQAKTDNSLKITKDEGWCSMKNKKRFIIIISIIVGIALALGVCRYIDYKNTHIFWQNLGISNTSEMVKNIEFAQSQGGEINEYESIWNSKQITDKDQKSLCDILAGLTVYKKKSSKEYMIDGYMLSYPYMRITTNNNKKIDVVWELGTGKIKVKKKEYYIDKQKGKKLNKLFLKYNKERINAG